MAVTDSQTLLRLRREESLAEQQGRQASNIAAILKDFPQYDAARLKADALLAKASALREQIVKIETLSGPVRDGLAWSRRVARPAFEVRRVRHRANKSAARIANGFLLLEQLHRLV